MRPIIFSKTKSERIFGTRISIESSRNRLVKTGRDTAVALSHVHEDETASYRISYGVPRVTKKAQIAPSQLSSGQISSAALS